MFSKANLFDANMKFDARKKMCYPESLDFVNHEEKLFFFKNKNSALKAGRQMKIKSIKSQAVKIICFL